MDYDQLAKLTADVEHGEAWLAGVMAGHPEPLPCNLEHVKLAVRIAADQSAVQLAPPPPSKATVSQIKQAVRSEIEHQQVRSIRVTSLWRRGMVAGALAAAALIALVAILWTQSEHPGPNEVTVANAYLEPLADFVAVLDDNTVSDLRADMLLADEEINEFADTFSQSDSVWNDSLFDDLEDEIDGVLNEYAASAQT